MAHHHHPAGVVPIIAAVAVILALALGALGSTFVASPPPGRDGSALTTHHTSAFEPRKHSPAGAAGSGVVPLAAIALGVSAAIALAASRAAATRNRQRASSKSYRDSLLRSPAASVARNFFGSDTSSSSSSAGSGFDPTTELGVQPPLGFWDPLGFTASGDEAAFKRRRSVELKHGRIAMLATIGYIIPEYYRFPGFLSPSLGVKFETMPTGLAAFSKVPALGWVQIIFFAGVIEGKFGFSDYKNGTPGEFGWTVITSPDPEKKASKLSAELANGRLAMMAIIGMFFQDGLTGEAWGDWALYTTSPLRALASERGVQGPAGRVPDTTLEAGAGEL